MLDQEAANALNNSSSLKNIYNHIHEKIDNR